MKDRPPPKEKELFSYVHEREPEPPEGWVPPPSPPTPEEIARVQRLPPERIDAHMDFPLSRSRDVEVHGIDGDTEPTHACLHLLDTGGVFIRLHSRLTHSSRVWKAPSPSPYFWGIPFDQFRVTVEQLKEAGFRVVPVAEEPEGV